jgi:hypothetical protein
MKVLNLSRPELEVNNDLDIRITVSDPQSMMLDLGRIRTAVCIMLIVPDPYDSIALGAGFANEPLHKECRYVLAGFDRSQSPWKSIPPDSEEIERKIVELTAIGRKFLRIFNLLPK